MNEAICLVAGLIIGGVFGYFERDTRDKIKDLYTKIPEPIKPDTGATEGSYGVFNPINQANQANSEVGISEPKTPELLEWENKEKLEKMQYADKRNNLKVN